MSRLALALSVPDRPENHRELRLPKTAFGRAVIASALIHGLLLAFVPGWRNVLPSMPLPERLEVLLKPPADIARPTSQPEVKLEPQPHARPDAQRQARRRVESREIAPRHLPEPPIAGDVTELVPPASAVAEPTRGIERAPERSLEPAPAPEDVKPIEPEAPRAAPVLAVPTGAMIAAYGNGFKTLIDKHRRYPRVAQERGWQGTATVLVRVLPGGRIGEVSIVRSSGFDLLDDTARDMVKSAQLPAMPEGLRNHGFEMRIPVEFRLV